MYRLVILLCLICSCKQGILSAKKDIADSIRDKVPLSYEQMAFHFNIDTTYANDQFSGVAIDKLGDSLYVARINCADDQLMFVFNRFTLKETDHMRLQKFSHLNDSSFTTEETIEGGLNTKTWKISKNGTIELKVNRIKQ
jgi:hypothetical protein